MKRFAIVGKTHESAHELRQELESHQFIFDERNPDIVLSYGGDGTFLEASHAVIHKPILGVNSDTNHSVGKFCNATKDNFERLLNAILSGRFKRRKLDRLKIRVNGKLAYDFILNDVLICHASPAAMSHYILHVGSVQEKQRSSGLWISTAAGSSGAAHSAGGRVLPLTSHKVQYRPRELYEGRGVRYRLKGGVTSLHKPFSVISRMQEGMIYVDGAHKKIPFHYGDKLTFLKTVPLQAVF